jgi:hypothetical protein
MSGRTRRLVPRCEVPLRGLHLDEHMPHLTGPDVAVAGSYRELMGRPIGCTNRATAIIHRKCSNSIEECREKME